MQGYIESADTIKRSSLFLAQREHWDKFGLPLDAPSQLTILESNSDFVKLAWLDISAEETGYQIEASIDGLVFEQGLTVPANTTEYEWKVDSFLLHTQYFRVSALGEKCLSAYSNVIINSPTTGITLENNPRFEIFPNPTFESIQIRSSVALTKMKIVNYIGKVVIEKKALDSVENSISLTNILPGIYFIELTDYRNRKWIEKLFKL